MSPGRPKWQSKKLRTIARRRARREGRYSIHYVAVSHRQWDDIERLHATGLFGATPGETLEELVRLAVREQVLLGWTRRNTRRRAKP